MPVLPDPQTLSLQPGRSGWLASLRASIGVRVALLAGTLLLIAMVLAGSLLVRVADETYRTEARERAASLLRTLAVPCAMSVAVHALERLDSYLGEVAAAGGEHMGILQVAMVDGTGQVLASSAATVLHEQIDPPLTSAFLRQAAAATDALWREQTDAHGRPVLLLSMPAVSGLRWGTLAAAFDLTPVEARIAWTRKTLAVLSLAFAAVVALALYVGLSRLLVQPVRTLAAAASAIQRGQLDARARLSRNDELGQLAAGFDQMASEIQSQTESLERKVAERSAEVQRKNEQLEAVNQQLQIAAEELARLARIDALTGVHNRRHFAQTLQAEAAGPAQTTLLMIDVDHFKRLNDAYGHPAGDVVLREVARLLSAGLRATDVLSRYGGEEFAAILPNTTRATGMEVAERLRGVLAQHEFGTAAGVAMGQVTVSIGVACLPEDAQTGDDLVVRADEALYAAKRAGRNRVETWRKGAKTPAS